MQIRGNHSDGLTETANNDTTNAAFIAVATAVARRSELSTKYCAWMDDGSIILVGVRCNSVLAFIRGCVK